MKDSVIEIKPLRFEDITTAVDIHQMAFPQFFLTFLGSKFLELLYGFYCEGKNGTGTLRKNTMERIVGVLLGTIDPNGFL